MPRATSPIQPFASKVKFQLIQKQELLGITEDFLVINRVGLKQLAAQTAPRQFDVFTRLFWKPEDLKKEILRYEEIHANSFFENSGTVELEITHATFEEAIEVYQLLRLSRELVEAARRSRFEAPRSIPLEIALQHWIEERLSTWNTALMRLVRPLFRQRNVESVEDIISKLHGQSTKELWPVFHELFKPQFIRNDEALRRALLALEELGYPLQRIEDRWQVNGAAYKYNLFLNSILRPKSERKLRDTPKLTRKHGQSWANWLENVPVREVGNRARLIVNYFGLRWEQIDAQKLIRKRAFAWIAVKGQTQQPEKLSQSLDFWGLRFGLEPVLLRTGIPRATLERQIYPDLPSMKLGERIKVLRYLAGLSRTSLAAVLGVEDSVLERLEAADDLASVKTPTIWPRVAKALAVDPFLILTGYPRAKAVRLASLTFGQRLFLLRLAAGKTAEQVAEKVSELSGKTVQRKVISAWERDEKYPPEVLHVPLAQAT